MNSKNGITLIALIITIIVLLILAGITIALVVGDNGILNKATDSKVKTIVGQEKEEISLAYSYLVSQKLVDNEEITDSRFENEINKNRGSNDVSVTSDLDEYIVHYEKTTHTYLVDKDGNITLIEDMESIENMEPTENIYVALKGDTLTFSNNRSDLGTLDNEPYIITKDTVFENQDDIFWKDERDQIIYVDFINTIIPKNTQLWFSYCENLLSIRNITNLKMNLSTSMLDMFLSCASLTNIDVSHFNTKNVINMQSVFNRCYNLTNIDVSHFDTRNVTNMSAMFWNCESLVDLDLSSFNTSKVTNMRAMFQYCNSLENINISSFDTRNVTKMSAMFANCTRLETVDLSNFDTKNVTDMNSMFFGCSSLTNINLSHFNTKNVINMQSVFNRCYNLTNIDVSNFDTRNVTDMSAMFWNCESLVDLDLSSFNTSKVTDMHAMFQHCNSLENINISSFDTRNVTDMNCMFGNCKKLETLDISSFDTRNVQNMEGMFNGYNDNTDTVEDMAIHTIYVSSSWNLTSVTNDFGMFTGCKDIVGENGTTYNLNKLHSEYARIDGGPSSSTPGYFTAKP